MLKEQLSLLISLARIDGNLADEELQLIKQIGLANGMTREEINDAIENPREARHLETLDDDERFEYIYNIVQLMKIDGKLYEKEIKFTSDVAARLGYDKAVLFELVTRIYTDPKITADREMLKKRVQRYLKK